MPLAQLSTSPTSPSANDWRPPHNAATGQFGMVGLSDVFGSDEEEESQAPVFERHATLAALAFLMEMKFFGRDGTS